MTATKTTTRLDVSFPSGGARCAAWLHLPATTPAPCVVMGNVLAGTRNDAIGPYAERFAAAGFAALVLDYRHLGESGGEPRQRVDIRRQQDDLIAAIAYTRSRDDVDAARIALFGASFSGGHVVHLAARDPSIAAVISHTPFMDGAVQLMMIPRRALPGIVLAGLRGETIPALGRPGEVAAMTSPTTKDGYPTLVGAGSRWRDEIDGRFMLTVGLYRPIKDAARITAPLLVCVADHDDLTPPAPAIKAAERAPRGELKRYDADHWSIYRLDEVVADQVEFLERHLGEAR